MHGVGDGVGGRRAGRQRWQRGGSLRGSPVDHGPRRRADIASATQPGGGYRARQRSLQVGPVGEEEKLGVELSGRRQEHESVDKEQRPRARGDLRRAGSGEGGPDDDHREEGQHRERDDQPEERVAGQGHRRSRTPPTPLPAGAPRALMLRR